MILITFPDPVAFGDPGIDAKRNKWILRISGVVGSRKRMFGDGMEETLTCWGVVGWYVAATRADGLVDAWEIEDTIPKKPAARSMRCVYCDASGVIVGGKWLVARYWKLLQKYWPTSTRVRRETLPSGPFLASSTIEKGAYAYHRRAPLKDVEEVLVVRKLLHQYLCGSLAE